LLPSGSRTKAAKYPSWYSGHNRGACRRYRTVQIRAGQHILTAEDPLPPDLREILALIK
jgi:hypothetical protein